MTNLDYAGTVPESIADANYVALTTYRKDGTARATPVWIADLGDGTLGFTTASSSYKVKRLAHNPVVLLQPSDSRGKPKADAAVLAGTATVHTDDATFAKVRDRIKQKYGIQFRAIALFGSMAKLIGKGSGTDAAVVVTLDPPTG